MFGQTNFTRNTVNHEFNEVRTIQNAVDVCASVHHSCALLDDGKVKCCGSSVDGQLGKGYYTPHNSQLFFEEPKYAVNVSDVSNIYCGGYHTCVLLNNGKVKCAGSNIFGQLGLLTSVTQKSNVFIEVPNISNVVDLGLGNWNTFFKFGAVDGENNPPVELLSIPSSNQSSGVFHSPINITLSTPDQGAFIRYTIDGSEPLEESLVYSSPISLDTNTLLKARAFKVGFSPSDLLILNYNFNLNNFSAKINFPENNSSFTENTNVSFLSNIVNSQGDYSCAWSSDLNGALSSNCEFSTSTLLVGTHLITLNVTDSENSVSDSIKLAIKKQIAPEDPDLDEEILYSPENEVAPEDPDLDDLSFDLLKVNLSVSSLPQGTYESKKIVSLSTTTSGAEIYYTLDDSLPTLDSSKYTEPIMVDKNLSLKAIAYKENFIESDVLVLNYVINLSVIDSNLDANKAVVDSDSFHVIISDVNKLVDVNFNSLITKIYYSSNKPSQQKFEISSIEVSDVNSSKFSSTDKIHSALSLKTSSRNSSDMLSLKISVDKNWFEENNLSKDDFYAVRFTDTNSQIYTLSTPEIKGEIYDYNLHLENTTDSNLIFLSKPKVNGWFSDKFLTYALIGLSFVILIIILLLIAYRKKDPYDFGAV